MVRVVIVDDEPIIRNGLCHLISRLPDFTVTETLKNGKEAVPAILKAPPDIIVSDIVMPQMDGIEMVRLLRESDIKSEIILLSGYREFEYAQSAIHYGVFDYINKPVNHNLLVDTLNRVVVKLGPRSEDGDPGVEYGRQIQEIIAYMQQNYDKDISIRQISKIFYINESYLSRIFKEKTGVNFTNYLTQIRMNKAQSLLSQGSYCVYEVAEMVGYVSPKYFAKIFRKVTGKTPHQFKSGGSKE